MLQITSHPAPGLSAIADRPLAAHELGTSRYRRWVERALLASAALQLRQSRRRAQDPAAGEQRGEAARIRLPSTASGTLSRLP